MYTEHFLKEEIRNDYVVSATMKKIWKVQLDLLSDFIEVCKEHDLKYWAHAGTLLGAVRHKGYIPWDDDLDVIMPRKDYEILSHHPEWFKSPSELHLPNSGENYYEGWLRLHNINTTCNYPCNHIRGGVHKQGIYIDILPFDSVEGRETEHHQYRIIKLLNILGHACFYNINPNKMLRLISKLNSAIRIVTPEALFVKINKVATKNSKEEWSFFRDKMTTISAPEKVTLSKQCYEKTITVPFEYMTIDIPAGYDEVLKQIYGNYMEFPPIEKRGAWHSFVFDPECSYKEYRE